MSWESLPSGPATTNDQDQVLQEPKNTSSLAAFLRPKTRKFIEEYAKVPPDRVERHIKAIQTRAWAICPYPSVGQMTWLNPSILIHASHDRILSRLKAGASIVDCGCMIAPDLRQLAYEGAPSNKMYGFDVEPRFFDLSFDFYNDRSSFQGKLLEADIFKSQSPLKDLEGQMDIIWCAKFMHLFNRDTQIAVAARLIKLLKPAPGTMFVGSQNGFPVDYEVPLSTGGQYSRVKGFWLGSKEGMEKLWKEVSDETGTKWEVDVRLLDLRTLGMHQDDGSEDKRRTGYNLQWTCTRVDGKHALMSKMKRAFGMDGRS
ncbi:hypothetical protein EV356DRAFT_506853 [Viridothelium virens]|uniref:Methyltransferase domain-containing protein n=1 Tax=Viridothelium virens TaxID=1048519 RepID=A0A6A6H1M0_VIRVR|nr:hypothetical protein EV356DRAFT_506853 [Viridothelium virens]